MIETLNRPRYLPELDLSARLRAIMGEDAGELGTPQEAPRKQKFIFFQMKADKAPPDRGYPHYSGPANAILALGIPKNPNKPVLVAFSTYGGSILHADLEGIAAPPNTDYQLVKGKLTSIMGKDKKARRILTILTLSEKHAQRMEQQGFPYPNPRVLLPESTLASLRTMLKANHSEFVDDTTPDETIRRAHTPPNLGGVEYLRWKDRTTEGD